MPRTGAELSVGRMRYTSETIRKAFQKRGNHVSSSQIERGHGGAGVGWNGGVRPGAAAVGPGQKAPLASQSTMDESGERLHRGLAAGAALLRCPVRPARIRRPAAGL